MRVEIRFEQTIHAGSVSVDIDAEPGDDKTSIVAKALRAVDDSPDAGNVGVTLCHQCSDGGESDPYPVIVQWGDRGSEEWAEIR